MVCSKSTTSGIQEGSWVCTANIFLISLLSRFLGRSLYIGLYDYEKAFDFLSRPRLLQDMMNQDIGCRFLKNVRNIYNVTSYVPQTSKTSLGDEIDTSFGVTQGKNSSANLFSCYVSDMHLKFDHLNCQHYMDPTWWLTTPLHFPKPCIPFKKRKKYSRIL